MQFSGSVMNPVEAEVCVRELRAFDVAEIGTEAWKNQREAVERLNMCTHSNAVNKVDDFVKSFLTEHEKLSTVLHELLVMEVWRQKVLDCSAAGDGASSATQLLEAIAGNPAAAYLYCSYESVLVNLLECICFYEEAVTGFGDDILELIDYCWRQVYFLFSLKRELAEATPADDRSASSAAQLRASLAEQSLARAMSSVSVLWFIVDRLGDLPLSVTNRVLNKHDLPVGLSEVLLQQPWQRRALQAGQVVTQKFRNGSFVDVSDEDALVVCTPEAHAWFCLHKLLCDPELRRQYQYTIHSKEIILRVRRFMNDTLLDQIPALESVRRALEELSFLEPPAGTEEKFKSNHLIVVEQVPQLMTAIMRRCDGDGWAERERGRLTAALRDPSERAKDAVRLAKVFDQMFAG